MTLIPLQTGLHTPVQRVRINGVTHTRFYPLWLFDQKRCLKEFVKVMNKSWDQLERDGWIIAPASITMDSLWLTQTPPWDKVAKPKKKGKRK